MPDRIPTSSASVLFRPTDASPPLAQDYHAYIHDMMGDASVLCDRMEYDPTALAGIVGRLINAVSILSDQNKALADQVERMTTRVDAQNRLIQHLAGVPRR